MIRHKKQRTPKEEEKVKGEGKRLTDDRSKKKMRESPESGHKEPEASLLGNENARRKEKMANRVW